MSLPLVVSAPKETEVKWRVDEKLAARRRQRRRRGGGSSIKVSVFVCVCVCMEEGGGPPFVGALCVW